MAEGRMLKKVICESPRLAALKNDTHRLIYTWMIPHLDVEGRHSADPRIVKSHVAPILDHITTKIIISALHDMAVNNLIALYSINGKEYLELQLFRKHQVLREGREKASDIPPPTPSVLRRPSVDTAQQDKIREDKLSKANAREGGLDQPVDNLPDNEPKEAPPEKEPDALMSELKEVTEDIGKMMPDVRKQRQVMLFIEGNIIRKNHNAMMHCLKSLQKQLQNGIEIDAPKQYLEAALKIEDGKHNAREYNEKAQEFKKPVRGEGASMGAILQNMARGFP